MTKYQFTPTELLELANWKDLREFARHQMKLTHVENEAGESINISNGNKGTLVKYLGSLIEFKSAPQPAPIQQPAPTRQAQKQDLLETLDLDRHSINRIRFAVDETGEDLQLFIEDALSSHAERIIIEYARSIAPDIPAPSQPTASSQTAPSSSGVREGSAYDRNIEAIEQVIAWNDFPEHQDNSYRLYITGSLIKRLTKSRKAVIDAAMADMGEAIESHHERYGLTEADNNKGTDKRGNRIKIGDLVQKSREWLVQQTGDTAPTPSEPAPSEPTSTQPASSKPESTSSEPTPAQAAPESHDVPTIGTPERVKWFCGRIAPVDGSAIAEMCADEMAALREHLNCYIVTDSIDENGKPIVRHATGDYTGNPASKLYNEARKYTDRAKGILMTDGNSYQHEYRTPRKLKPGESAPSQAEFIEVDGEQRVKSERRHLARKLMTLTEAEHAFRDPKTYADHYTVQRSPATGGDHQPYRVKP
ncbi:MAG: hypothetical protein HC910_21775 [Spirulinaceae cyanobacterium SM2_1_0]|nr:hypothetical protein [Spirulinaceae cyanobacterium SM2_1_0]